MIWKFGRLPSTSINLPRRISTTHGNIGDCWMGCWVCLRYHHQEETLVHDCEAAMFVTVSWYQNRHGSYTVSKSSTISNAFLTKTIPQSKVSNEKQQNPHSKLFPGNWWFIMEILFLKNHQFLEVYKSSIQVFKIIQIPDVFLGNSHGNNNSDDQCSQCCPDSFPKSQELSTKTPGYVVNQELTTI